MRKKARGFVSPLLKVLAPAAGALAFVWGAQGQIINYWTNSVSARWESPSWELGILPAADQTVKIINPGYKAVNIDSATFSGYPESLTIRNLVVSELSGSGLSTLLLNYAGMAAPLKILNGCHIGTNGTISNLESRFEVDAAYAGDLLVDGGTYFQQGGQAVVTGPVTVRNGNLSTTNGNLTLGNVTVGSGFGSLDPYTPDAVLTQDGGSIAAQSINIKQGGTYHLNSGVLYAINGTTCTGCPFFQYGGTNYGDINTLSYYYRLRGGMVQGNVLTAANGTGFVQDAGLLDMKVMNITGTTNWPVLAGSWFYGGTVHCGTLNIGGNASVEMRGTDFVITNNFDLHGTESTAGDQGTVIEHAACTQWGGLVLMPSMSLGKYAYFSQMGGSTQIRGGLSASGGQYTLYGGKLETPYTGVGADATFGQGGGQHLVNGVLSITGTYGLTGFSSAGCSVVCQGVYLRGTLTMKMNFNGRYFDPAATFTNTGELNLGGTLSTELPDIQAGQVQLATNALIDLSVRYPAVIHFQNSSTVDWTAGALLVITNWSSSGSSADHLFAGKDASGLSGSQLQQVQFVNPSGFAPGMYAAQILSTGEIVPGQQQQQGPALTATRMPAALVLTWSGNEQLMSATNVTGPYMPVPGASSPWTNRFSASRQFFRLQPSP